MSDPVIPAAESTPAEQTPATPAQPATPPAQPAPNPSPAVQAAVQTAQEIRAGGTGQNNDQLLTAINAIPEQIVNSIKEAFTPPKEVAPPKPAEEASGGGSTPAKKSFAQRWFGS